ncbi:MAG: cupin domain-containing protein [Alphaproteobacteria bacterium]|nr:cupin domain-containing protein [Alphaproteobacteria bacterium]
MQTVNRPYCSWVRSAQWAAVFAVGLVCGHAVSARNPPSGAQPLQVHDVLATSVSVVGEPIQYPKDTPSLITAKIITLLPGQATVRHTHPMPTFGYILEGEIEVDYGPKGKKTFRQGQALMEAMAHTHQGRNVSAQPVKVLAVSIGVEGLPTAIAAPK